MAYEKEIDPRCADSLHELECRGIPVRRASGFPIPELGRAEMTDNAFRDGFTEIFWVNPDITFHPDDVDRLRFHAQPLVCGIFPDASLQNLDCEFLPNTPAMTLGRTGGLTILRYARLGFAFIRRSVFDLIAVRFPPPPRWPPAPQWFRPLPDPDTPSQLLSPDFAFCERARQCGIDVLADTTIRLFRIGPYPYSWEDIGRKPQRFPTVTLQLGRSNPEPVTAPPITSPRITAPPDRHPLRGHAQPLSSGFPRLRAYIPTYPANADSLARTLASLRESDWGDDPVIVEQPADWPKSRESAARTYKRVLERAADDGCDFALVLEDDVRIGHHIRHNLLTLPLVCRDQCDYLGLFIPDLIADPWERTEPHLGYRLAKPRYIGPNALWERSRMWGSQGYLLSRRFIRAALERWDLLTDVQDVRVMGICRELDLPLWYTAPCLVEHAPLTSAFGTPPAYAPDFDPDFRLEIGPGFQPPEVVPGWFSLDEGRLLWQVAAGRTALELGTAAGRSTVCLVQSASRVVSVDVADQSEADEWVRRYGFADQVTFHRGDTGAICRALLERYGLAFVDTEHDGASVARDIEAVLPILESGALVAFHDYPDPGWPDVRRVVDGYARQLGWKRIAQAGFLGVFRT